MKKILLLAVISLTTTAAFSQTFRNGIGVGYALDHSINIDPSFGVFFTYVPRIDFAETEKTSVSVALPLTVGGSFGYVYSSSFGDETNFNANINVPLVVNFNMGAGSSRQNHSRLGWFVGGGFAYHFTASSEVYGYYDENNNYVEDPSSFSDVGPLLNGGMRIGMGRKGRNLEIKLSYFHGLGDQEKRLYMMGCLFNF